MGQHRDALGPVILYEYDFEATVHGSYIPAYTIR